MMAEVMPDVAKGNVTMDETCENTRVVNELNIPVLCMGCKDMIVAVSGDGILVSDKESSGYMKPFVEKIGTDVHFAEKSWGTYTVIDEQPGSMTVKISLRKGNMMKYHSHELRDEAWNIISGEGRAIIDGEECAVYVGDVLKIAAGSKHTLIAAKDMSIIEVQVGTEISKSDKRVYPLDS
jgi:mannose-1-phosphate guanylyltransferase